MRSKSGAEKTLFGSNGLSWDRYLMELDRLEIPADRAELIVSGNARRIYRL